MHTTIRVPWHVTAALFVVLTTSAHAVSQRIDRCRIEANIFGLMGEARSVTTIRDSVLACNAWGTDVFGNPSYGNAELNVERYVVTANSSAGILGHGDGVDPGLTVIRVSNTTVTSNGTGLDNPSSATFLSRGNNTVEGNGTNGTFTGAFAAK